MSAFATNVDRLLYLAEMVCDESASKNELAELNSILLADDASRRCYLNYYRMRVALRLELRAHRAAQNVRHQINVKPVAPAPSESDAALLNPPFSPLPLLSGPLPGTFGWFSSGWPVAYLVATVIFGIGLLVGSVVQVSEPAQVARQSSMPSRTVAEPKTELVGRITGMVDCKWVQSPESRVQSSALDPRLSTLVSLGDKFTLASGLMEITYNTGAKVILQGPVTYEVESAAGGYLSVGKLTAKLANTARDSNPQSPIPNPSLSTNHHPLFTIKTPTATVIDLGTEFGVEAVPGGATKTHVFAGHVQVTAMGGRNGGSRGLLLRAGQDAICDGTSPTVRIVASSLEPTGAAGPFVRTLASPNPSQTADAYADFVLSLRPVVYYRMEPPKDEKDRNVVFDSAPGHHHGVLHFSAGFVGAPYVSGRFGHALRFRGPMVGDYVIVPDYPKATSGRLTVSVWALAGGRMERWPAIVNNWSFDEQHGRAIGQFNLCLFREIGDLTAQVTAQSEIREGPANMFPLGVWQHVAMVFDGSSLRLYRNGTEIASGPATGFPRQDPVPALGIGCCLNRNTGTDADAKDPCYWQGRIDELAIFNEALSAEQVRQLYTGPANTAGLSTGDSAANKNGTGAKP